MLSGDIFKVVITRRGVSLASGMILINILQCTIITKNYPSHNVSGSRDEKLTQVK